MNNILFISIYIYYLPQQWKNIMSFLSVPLNGNWAKGKGKLQIAPLTRIKTIMVFKVHDLVCVSADKLLS